MFKTWANVAIESVITKVFLKLEKIICLISEGDGGNDLVNMKREKANTDMNFYFKAKNVKLEAVTGLLTLDESDNDEMFATF